MDNLKRSYEERTGLQWESKPGGAWLRNHREEFELITKTMMLVASAHIDLSDKISWLIQVGCRVCNPDSTISVIPLRIAPESWQSLDSLDKSAFKAAIAHRLAGSPHIGRQEGRICLTLLFACSASRKLKDVDNMAKLLMDSIKGKVMGDDREVDHLSIMRLDHDGDEEFVYFRISSSSLNNHQDVAEWSMNHTWAGAEALRLEDFQTGSNGKVASSTDASQGAAANGGCI